MRSIRTTVGGGSIVATVIVGSIALAGCGSSSNGGGGADGGSAPGSQGAGKQIAKRAAATKLDCSAAKRGGAMTVGVSQDVISFDPANTQDNGSLWGDMNVYDQLVELTPDAKKVVPGLATRWRISNGGKTWTFTLRHAQFSDGTPVTAQDVKFSWDRARSPKALANFALSTVQSTKVIDAHTFQATLKTVYAPFLNDIALWPASVVSRAAVQREGASYKNHPVGSGPFSVASFKPGSAVVLKRNPHYWNKDACGHPYPYLDRVTLRYMPNDNTRITALQGGQIDATTNVPYSQVANLNSGDIVSAVTPQLGIVAMGLSQKVPAFRDPKVVQAINYAIDRKAIVKSVFFGNASPAGGPVDPGVYFSTKKYGYSYDLAKAKALIKSTSFAKGFSATLSIPAGDSLASAVATILQSELKAIGVTLRIQSLDSTTLSQQEQQQKLQISYSYGTSDNLDPNANALFCCVSDGGAKSGYTGWVDKSADALFHRTQTEMNFKQRGVLYDQWQKQLLEKGPFVWLVNPTNAFAYHKDIHDFFLQATAHYPLWVAWKG